MQAEREACPENYSWDITKDNRNKVIWCTGEHELDLTLYPYSCLKTDRKAVQFISINYCIYALKKKCPSDEECKRTAVLVRTAQRLQSWLSLGQKQTSTQTGSQSRTHPHADPQLQADRLVQSPACCVMMARPAQEGADVQQINFKRRRKINK